MGRILELIRNPDHPNPKYVLYWMQQSQRLESNHAIILGGGTGESKTLAAGRLVRPRARVS
ncbi:MAG: hypothetical protein MZU97_05475 [Bacillus subtilis]|nr:hypothetical protein [Bacillus subtilis]